MQPQSTSTADLLEAFASMVADRIVSRANMPATVELARQINRLERLAKEPWHVPADHDGISYDHEADSRWGFSFAVNGVAGTREAQLLMGGCSERTLNRHVLAGRIRRGKDGRRAVYCRRSIMRYLASLEE